MFTAADVLALCLLSFLLGLALGIVLAYGVMRE